MSTGESTEPKSKWNYLNGEHYQSVGQVGPVPVVIEKRAKPTLISGRTVLTQSSQYYERPLKDIELVLLRGDVVLARSRTDEKGQFSFAGDFANGHYDITLDSKHYRGQWRIQVKDYEMKNLTLRAALAEPALSSH